MSQLITARPNLGSSTSQAYRDWLGVGASVLCAIHCAAMPFVVGFLPLLGLSFLADPAFHKWMVGICLALALLAFVPGWRRHHRLAPAIIGVVGLSLITFAAFAGPEDCCPTPCDGTAVAANDESACSASCCGTTPSESTTNPTTTITAERRDMSCVASCCASPDAKTASTQTASANSGPEPDETVCAASCCSTQEAKTTTVVLADTEPVIESEPEACVAICCPEESSTIANAGSGEFMSLVWLLMTPLGGVILVAAHLTNHRFGCQCKAECCPHGHGKKANP